MSESGTSRSHLGHQRFCWMRVWHSPWSWLKLIVAAESVAGNTRTGTLTRLILRKPFQVGLAAMGGLSAISAGGVSAGGRAEGWGWLLGGWAGATTRTSLHSPTSNLLARAR